MVSDYGGMRMNRRKRKIVVFTVAAVILAALIILTAWGNTALELNSYTISSDKLPEVFDGYRIAHVSDLHNTEIGKDNEKLLAMLKDAEPDIIVITGDLIDSRNTDIEIALHFAEEAEKIAPCYYVTGNHEARMSGKIFADFEANLIEAGVVCLHDSEVLIEREDARISLVGIDDPAFAENNGGGVGSGMDPDRIDALSTNDGFTILLSHRPEFFDQYVKADVDLVLSGHAHGGQFRLPFVGGLVAPNQGLFPKYDAGLYTEENTHMIVSKGIGNSIFPFRFNNRPEIILIEIGCKQI